MVQKYTPLRGKKHHTVHLVFCSGYEYTFYMARRKESMLLQLKLTGLFVVFGLLIGLLSSFTSTVTTAKMIADTFLDSDTNPVGKLLSKYPHDWIYAVFTQKTSSDARNLLKDIVPPEFKKSISLTFYYKKIHHGLRVIVNVSSYFRSNSPG